MGPVQCFEILNIGNDGRRQKHYTKCFNCFHALEGSFDNGADSQSEKYRDRILSIFQTRKESLRSTFASDLPPCVKVISISMSLPIYVRQRKSFLRCLSGMIDLGNPAKLGGKRLWEDYAPKLETIDIFSMVRTPSSTATAGFGDGPQQPRKFVTLQVRFWSSTSDGAPLLVLENIILACLIVGLFDEKSNLSAL